MSRDVSATARAQLYAPQTTEVFLQLLTIDHPDMDAPVYLVDNTEDIVSRGNTFLAFPFAASLPPDVAGELPEIDITTDAVTRDLIIVIRSISTPASMTLELIAASAPDVVEAGPFLFDLTSVQYSAQEIRMTLTVEQLLSEPYPAGLFNPADWPLLFNPMGR